MWEKSQNLLKGKHILNIKNYFPDNPRRQTIVRNKIAKC